MSESSKLSAFDVKKLLTDPSTENRAETAHKVAAHFQESGLSESERAIAEDIFRVMVRDAERRVRQALADSLRESAEVPHDVAVSIANDVAEIAVPFIEVSKALSDEDLVAIIQAKGAEHQMAIARRENVSESVADALVETNNEGVVAALVANEGAEISGKAMDRVLDEFGHLKSVSMPMAKRAQLPLGIAERLVSFVSTKIQDQLLSNHDISPDLAMDLIIQSRERATVSLLNSASDAPDVYALIDQLYNNGRLTPSIIIRALCMGDLTFFEGALAKRAGIPVLNVYKLVHMGVPDALAKLFEKAEIPESMWKLAHVALDVAQEMTPQSSDDRVQFRKVTLERVLTHFEDDFDGDNLDYFISKLSTKPSGNASAAKN